jgi:hypothetical protein
MRKQTQDVLRYAAGISNEASEATGKGDLLRAASLRLHLTTELVEHIVRLQQENDRLQQELAARG